MGLRPATVAQLRDYIVAVKALLRGEEADYQGRRFRMQWTDLPVPAEIPVVVPVSGPKVLRMACEVSDGMLLSMGFGPHNVDYVNAAWSKRAARRRAAIRASWSCGGTPRSSSATAPRRPSAAAWA